MKTYRYHVVVVQQGDQFPNVFGTDAETPEEAVGFLKEGARSRATVVYTGDLESSNSQSELNNMVWERLGLA